MDTPTVTTTEHGYSVGDEVTFTGLWTPWYVRFWRWVTRYEPPVYRVSEVTSTTFTIGPEGE